MKKTSEMSYIPKWVLLILVWPSIGLAQTYSQPCHLRYLARSKNFESVFQQAQRIYNFQKGETIASVGAGTANKEVIYAQTADSLTFYLQDIDSTCLSRAILNKTISTLLSKVDRQNTAVFLPVIGTETETKLPQNSVDKLLIENSLHEFTEPEKILKDIASVLKKNGKLFILEFISAKDGVLHQGCKKPLFTDQTLKTLLRKCNYRFVSNVLADLKLSSVQVYMFIKVD